MGSCSADHSQGEMFLAMSQLFSPPKMFPHVPAAPGWPGGAAVAVL